MRTSHPDVELTSVKEMERPLAPSGHEFTSRPGRPTQHGTTSGAGRCRPRFDPGVAAAPASGGHQAPCPRRRRRGGSGAG
jgi:hypothetical protein